jgi:hypothetical protein
MWHLEQREGLSPQTPPSIHTLQSESSHNYSSAGGGITPKASLEAFSISAQRQPSPELGLESSHSL